MAQHREAYAGGIILKSLAYGDDVRIHPLAHIRYNLATDLDTWHRLPVSSLLSNFLGQAVQNDFVLRRGNELTLSPSNFGSVRVANNSTLYLAPGEYNIKNIILGTNAQIIANSAEGRVTVNISGNLKSRKGSTLFSADETQMIFNIGRNISLGNGNKVFAMLNSANNMKIGNDSIVTGSFVAGKNLRLGKNLQVNSVKTNAIPEPTTLALLSGGLLSILARRRVLGRGRAWS